MIRRIPQSASPKPLLTMVPCLSGAPWDLDALGPLAAWPRATYRLDDRLDDIETQADDLLDRLDGVADYVLVGDSFGANVALAAATRRPAGLRALVLSGGFAANPVTAPVARAKIEAARVLPGPLYDRLVVPLHAHALASAFDAGGEGWTTADTARLFRDNTPWAAYVRRTRAALAADYRDRLGRIAVPTLVLTPEDDTLIGPDAARILVDGIPDAREVVMTGTGHMLRFTHPTRYAQEVRAFLEALDRDGRLAA